MSASQCWLHGVHLPPKVSWPQGLGADFRACCDNFLLESAERRYRLEKILQRAAAGQTLTSKSRSSSRWCADFSGLRKPSGSSPLCLSKEGILWEENGMSSLLIPILLADVMFAPVYSKLASPFSRAPDATHIILIAPRASGGAKSVVWLLCTSACGDCSLDHLIMSLSRRGAVRWDSRQCLHLSVDSLGRGSQGTIFRGLSLLPLYEEHRKLIPSKADLLHMSNVHNFGRVAVKIWDQLDSAMVRQEVGFLQQSAGHPNISALLGVYAEARKFSVTWFLAMEHGTEGDLFNKIKAKCLPLGLILDIQAGLSSALTHLHFLHIVHRDVKAENVVMHKDRAVLIDFGIAAYRHDQEAMCQSTGSPGYAAPEMVAVTMQCYDELVDVFALGVLSYFMMFRALPFLGNTHAETLEKTRSCEAEIPELKDEGWRAVASLVQRMMSREAKDRPTARACFKELLDLEPLVTTGGKSRAVRIAHAALSHYGHLDAPGDCSLEEFCGKDAPDMSEEALPSAGAAASTAPSLGGVGRIWTSAKRRIRSIPLPPPSRARQNMFQALRSFLRSSDTSVSKVPQEAENTSGNFGGDRLVLSSAVGVLPRGDAEADPAEAIGARQKAETLAGTGATGCSCRSRLMVADSQNDQEREHEHARIVLDFPLSASVVNVPLQEDLDDMRSEEEEDHPSLLVATPQGQHGASSDHAPAEGASVHQPFADHDAASLSGKCPEFSSGHRHFFDCTEAFKEESQKVLEAPTEADAFEFAPVVSGDLE
ncbi:mlkA [Symbiodinium sp. KB8]|nr:mlkA [Symbiodinium sp. KB8]